MQDAAGQTDSTTVTIAVTPPKLTAVPDSASTSAGTLVTIDVLTNDTGGTPPLIISAVAAQNSNGTVVIDASQTQLSYTPNLGFSCLLYTSPVATTPAAGCNSPRAARSG